MCQGCQWNWVCIFSSQISIRPTSSIFVKWDFEYMYFLRHIQNENVYPCVDLGVYPNFPDRVLRDHCWLIEQIANRNLSIQMHLCISWKDQYGACRILSQFQSKHLRCCTILGMEKGLKICFMFTFLVYSGSHFWFVYLITHCSFSSYF